MDNKKIENLIEDSLNFEKPNKKVLSAAKEVMERNKRQPKRTFRYYAMASCSVILLIFGIIFVIPVKNNGSAMNTTTLNAFGIAVYSYGLIIGISLIVVGVALGTIAILLKMQKRK